MNAKLESLIEGGFISPLTLAIVFNCRESQVCKLLRGEGDDELAERVKQLVELYEMAISRENAEILKTSIVTSEYPR
jgi:hypothetical protein